MKITFKPKFANGDAGEWLMRLSNRPRLWLREQDWETAAAAEFDAAAVRVAIANFRSRRMAGVYAGVKKVVFDI